MVRLRNADTGVVVSVDDVTAASLGAGFEPVAAPDEKQPTGRRSKKSDNTE